MRQHEPDADAGGAIEGVPVDIGAKFDGWGYAHLYRRGSGKLNEVGAPYAIPEGISEQYATDFGDLSIHEFATDPDRESRLRVVLLRRPARRELRRRGDSRRSAATSMPPATTSGASSSSRRRPAVDRRVRSRLRAVHLPVHRAHPAEAAADNPQTVNTPPAGTPAGAKPDRTDPLISLLSNRRQSLRTLRTTGLRFRIRVNETARVEVALRGRLTSTIKRGARGKSRMLKNNGAISVSAGQTVTVTLRPSAALRRKLTDERRLPGLLSVKAVDAAGNDATRTKVLTFR